MNKEVWKQCSFPALTENVFSFLQDFLLVIRDLWSQRSVFQISLVPCGESKMYVNFVGVCLFHELNIWQHTSRETSCSKYSCCNIN